MENYKEEIYKGYKIEICYDDCAESPESWGDDNLFLVGYHRDFWVDKNKKISQGLAQCIFNKGKYEDGSINDEAKDYLKKYHIFPLSAYIHSGVRLYLEDYKVCQWDSCQVGLVFVAKEEWKTRKSAEKTAESYLKTWNDYLSGQVYGFRVLDKDEEEIGSCWGFYGDEGIKDAIKEAQGEIDFNIEEENKNLLATKELVFG